MVVDNTAGEIYGPRAEIVEVGSGLYSAPARSLVSACSKSRIRSSIHP